MQEFFMDYGLWLLIGLLVVIGVIVLLSGRKKAQDPAPLEKPVPLVVEEQPATPIPAQAPVAAEPAAPLVQVPMADEPPAIPVSPAVTAPTDEEDDLLTLKGVGPKLQALLIDLGVTRFAQIAAWTDQDVAAIDARLGNFKGRPMRDQWIDQAKYLAARDIAGFEARYGKL